MTLPEEEKLDMLSFRLQPPHITQLGPRCGQLVARGKPMIQTPSYIASTSRGVVPHVTPDILQKHTSVSVVYLGLEDFIEKSPNAAPIFKSYGTDQNVSAISYFTGLSNHYLTILGPRRLPVLDNPRQNDNSAVAISTSIGFSNLKIEDYNAAVGTLRPDISLCAADIIKSEGASRKRIEKSSDRTHAWLRDTLDYVGVDDNIGTAILASILPLEPQMQSFYLADLASEYENRLSGFYLSDMYSTSSVPDNLRSCPRVLIHDAKNPHELLQAIEQGIDLVTVPFVTASSEAGIAFTFALEASFGDQSASHEQQPLGYDLWSTAYGADSSPLVPECLCYTCTRHHKAYVHHLLQAKEMLAWTLLQIHNFHVIHRFFGQIQQSVKDGSFEAKSTGFQQSHLNKMPLQTGEGPRIRGYHSKSVGGGEPKKNRKVYGRLEEQARKIEEATSGIATPAPDADATTLEDHGFAKKIC